jgi:hypothetical protein
MTHVLLVGTLTAALAACGSDGDTIGRVADSSAPRETSGVTSSVPATVVSTTAVSTTSAESVPAEPRPAYHWRLDGDGEAETGSTDLTAAGGATWSADGLVLDGTSGYAATPQPGPIDTTSSFTVAAWVKPDGIEAYDNVVSQLGEVAGAFFLGYGENTWNFAIKPADSNEPGVTRRVETGVVNPVPSSWTHLAGVYDDVRGTAQLYVNGHAATTDGVEVPAPFAAAGALHIGNAQAHSEPANFWKGTIADVGVYDEALDAEQIAELVSLTAPSGATLDAPPPPVGSHCPFPSGGKCLGPIPSGTYTTTTFQPSITYTVPEGWVNGEDLPGNFLLQLERDPRYLGIYRNVAAPFECQERPDPSTEHTVEGITAWLTSHPGLVTTEPTPVTVGGLHGVYLDIALDPSWTKKCPFSSGPVVPFIIGTPPSSFHHVILPGFEERLYLLDNNGSGNVAIEVGPEGASLPDYLQQVTPIIDSLQLTG